MKSTILVILFSMTGLINAGYFYNVSGEDWSGKCLNGSAQSPIDIPASLFRDPKSAIYNPLLHGADVQTKLEFSTNLDFHASYGVIRNKTIDNTDPNTIKLYFEQGSLVLVDELDRIKIFQILQMHFHAPAEHTFNNQTEHYDLELHIVHKRFDETQANELAVLGIFFDTRVGLGNVSNPFIQSLNLQALNNNSKLNIILISPSSCHR